MGYGYTAAGRISTLTYPGDGHVVTYNYDEHGRLQQISDWLGNTTTYSYDVLDRVVQVDLPNGTKQITTYDGRGDIASIAHSGPDDAVFAGATYGRDAIGRVTSAEVVGEAASSTTDETGTFEYDKVNRLLQQTTGGTTLSYQFDDNGNLISKSDGSTTTDYGYDSLNRLTSISDGTDNTVYTYDIRGERISTTHNTVETRYQRSGRRIFTFSDSAGTVQSYHIHGSGLLYSLDTSGTIRVYHGDVRGSVTAITDGARSVVKNYRYDPYGRVIGSAGPVTDNPFTYIGRHGVMQDDNGLYQMQARYYDPELAPVPHRGSARDKTGCQCVRIRLRRIPMNFIDPEGLEEASMDLRLHSKIL